MATVDVHALSFVSVQSIKPSNSYGALDKMPLKSGAKEILVRAPLPTLPRGSVITSAELHMTQSDAWSGANTLKAHRNLESWKWSATWDNRPNVRSTATDSVTKTGSSAGTVWVLDVTADVQAWFDGTLLHNVGWTIRTNNSTTAHYVRGTKSTNLKPFLRVEYEITPRVPTELVPQGGAVSVAKPVVTFQTSENMIALQVQIDAAADSVSPDFDSGEVAATGAALDLSTTAYAGLADGSTTHWRARAKSAGGWSRWSAWVSFSRADFDSLTLDSPTSTTSDTSPPFLWTFGGTQSAWRADLFVTLPGRDLPFVKLLRSSGLRSGTDDTWTPAPVTGPYFGKTMTARIRVFDDVTRVATPGAHTYVEDSIDFIASFTGSVDPMDTLVAASQNPVPGITLSGTRAAGIPDEVAVFHDDVMVARLDGGDVFTSSTAFSFTDWWARMGREVTITVVPIVNGEFADDAPEATLTPSCSGLWLVEPDTGTAAVLWGQDAGSWARPDLATEHVDISGQIIRRRLSTPARSGSVSGDIIDVGPQSADDTLDAFDTFIDFDAGTVYRLIAGQMNLPVLAGNFLTAPTPRENAIGGAWSLGQFDWWGADEPVISDGE